MQQLFSRKKYNLDKDTAVLLLCGIANPKTIESELISRSASVKMLRFKDHHIYDSLDIKKIKDEFSKIDSSKKILITTEKDAARLTAFEDEIKVLPLFALPMSHHFLFNEENKFEKIISEYCGASKTPDRTLN